RSPWAAEAGEAARPSCGAANRRMRAAGSAGSGLRVVARRTSWAQRFRTCHHRQSKGDAKGSRLQILKFAVFRKWSLQFDLVGAATGRRGGPARVPVWQSREVQVEFARNSIRSDSYPASGERGAPMETGTAVWEPERPSRRQHGGLRRD